MIRIGLIGFGLAGRVFHAPLISSVEGLELAAVLERSTDEAVRRYPGIRVIRVLDEMLADPSFDLLVVATPNATHFELARQALEAGKHVIVDKPVATRSAEIAQLIELARGRNLHLIPFHNRRWDGDYLTVRKLIEEGVLGRIVHFTSRFDRWRPQNPANRLWTEDPTQGGILLNLSPHLVDQALCLFGLPLAVSAEILRERDGEGANDSFTIRLQYSRLMVTLASNYLSVPAGPRFHLRGTRGNYWKHGLDPQEAALNHLTRIPTGEWGAEPQADWGKLYADVDGSIASHPVETLPGDYRQFYIGVRDALLNRTELPVTPVAAWHVARILEWAGESTRTRCEIPCSWPELA